MKNKRKIFTFLSFILIVMCIFELKSCAMTLPWLSISSNKYSNGDKLGLEEINKVEVGKTIQLYSMIVYGNDVIVDDNPNSLGQFVSETNLTGVSWTSSDTSVATVDDTGKVTGIKKGKATIIVNYLGGTNEHEKEATKEIEVIDNYVGITIVGGNNQIPAVPIILDSIGRFIIHLDNIPDSQKGNVKLTIENEEIAKIESKDLCESEDGSGTGMIVAEVKGLKEGTTKIIAKLIYDGNDYTGECSFDVVKSQYTLKIFPIVQMINSDMSVNDFVQLKAELEIYGGSLLPEDVTSKVEWSTSNKEIAEVNETGLVTAISEGTAIITAKYKVGDEVILANYNIKIKNSSQVTIDTGNITIKTEEPINQLVNSDNTVAIGKLPKTGVNMAIVFLIIPAILLVIVFLKKYFDYKNIK